MRAATTARPSATEALFFNEFTLFPVCETMECHTYHRSKAEALGVYSLNDESTIPNIKSTTAAIDLSAVVCAKVGTAAAKKV